MQRVHLHRLGWIYIHKPEWHLFEMRLEHMVHDPRFWAAVALAVILGGMIALAILSSGTGTDAPLAPFFPYPPYLP